MSEKFHGGIVVGSTDITIPILLRSTTDSTAVTGKLHSDVTAYYWRQGGSPTVISAVTLASITEAHSDGGFLQVDATNMKGLYRFDIPDAAFASGADWVVIAVTVSGAYVVHREYALYPTMQTHLFTDKTIQTLTIETMLTDIWAVIAGNALANDATDPTSVTYDSPDDSVQVTHTTTSTARTKA